MGFNLASTGSLAGRIVPGYTGNALLCGYGQPILLGFVPFNSAKTYTLECWVKPAVSLTYGSQCIALGRSGVFQLLLDGRTFNGVGDNRFSLMTFGFGQARISSTTAYTTGTWYKIKAIVSASSASLYVNDVLEATGPGTNFSGTHLFSIGSDANQALPFSGVLDQVKLKEDGVDYTFWELESDGTDSLGGGGSNPPAINSSLTASATANAQFTYQIAATNTPTSFSIAGIQGFHINSAGLVSGTFTAAGTYQFTIVATNNDGSDFETVTVTVVAAAPVIITAPSYTIGANALVRFYIQAINDPTSWNVTGLPAGMSLESHGSYAYIVGDTFSVLPGVYPVTITATNAGGTATQYANIQVNTQSPWNFHKKLLVPFRTRYIYNEPSPFGRRGDNWLYDLRQLVTGIGKGQNSCGIPITRDKILFVGHKHEGDYLTFVAADGTNHVVDVDLTSGNAANFQDYYNSWWLYPENGVTRQEDYLLLHLDTPLPESITIPAFTTETLRRSFMGQGLPCIFSHSGGSLTVYESEFMSQASQGIRPITNPVWLAHADYPVQQGYSGNPVLMIYDDGVVQDVVICKLTSGSSGTDNCLTKEFWQARINGFKNPRGYQIREFVPPSLGIDAPTSLHELNVRIRCGDNILVNP